MKASSRGYHNENEIGGGKPAPGTYHVAVKAGGAVERATKNDDSPITVKNRNREEVECSLVACEVLAGTVPGQAGKAIDLFIKYEADGNVGEHHIKFLMCCGLLLPDSQRDVDFEQEVPGCQLFLKLDTYKDKNGKEQLGVADFGMAMWGLDNSEVAGVPRCQEAIDIWREKRGQAGKGNGAKSPAPLHSAASADAHSDLSNI